MCHREQTDTSVPRHNGKPGTPLPPYFPRKPPSTLGILFLVKADFVTFQVNRSSEACFLLRKLRSKDKRGKAERIKKPTEGGDHGTPCCSAERVPQQ